MVLYIVVDVYASVCMIGSVSVVFLVCYIGYFWCKKWINGDWWVKEWCYMLDMNIWIVEVVNGYRLVYIWW